MSELNERDLAQVSGGRSESELDEMAEGIYQQIVAKDCGDCKRKDKSDCRVVLRKWCRDVVNDGVERRKLRCLIKQ